MLVPCNKHILGTYHSLLNYCGIERQLLNSDATNRAVRYCKAVTYGNVFFCEGSVSVC